MIHNNQSQNTGGAKTSSNPSTPSAQTTSPQPGTDAFAGATTPSRADYRPHSGATGAAPSPAGGAGPGPNAAPNIPIQPGPPSWAARLEQVTNNKELSGTQKFYGYIRATMDTVKDNTMGRYPDFARQHPVLTGIVGVPVVGLRMGIGLVAAGTMAILNGLTQQNLATDLSYHYKKWGGTFPLGKLKENKEAPENSTPAEQRMIELLERISQERNS